MKTITVKYGTMTLTEREFNLIKHVEYCFRYMRASMVLKYIYVWRVK